MAQNTCLHPCNMSVMCSLCVQNVEFVRTGYGKNTVKVLVIRRQGSHHYIIELKADVELTLKSRKDYLSGDNSDIIPTDTIKNTVHALAKIKGVGHHRRVNIVQLVTSMRDMATNHRPYTTPYPLSTHHNTSITPLTAMSTHRKKQRAVVDQKGNCVKDCV